MRKIEQQIVDAIKNGTDFNKRNSSVEHHPKSGQVSIMRCELVSQVYLHGNLIAEYDEANKGLTVYDGGYQSNTTKSRLNAILSGMGVSYGIAQRNFAWYVINRDGKLFEFDGMAKFDVENNVFLGK